MPGPCERLRLPSVGGNEPSGSVQKEHHHVVVMGSARVGKSSIVSQFLYDKTVKTLNKNSQKFIQYPGKNHESVHQNSHLFPLGFSHPEFVAFQVPGKVPADGRGAAPRRILPPGRGLAHPRHPGHVGGLPVPRHARALHQEGQRFHPRIRHRRPELLGGGCESAAADPRVTRAAGPDRGRGQQDRPGRVPDQTHEARNHGDDGAPRLGVRLRGVLRQGQLQHHRRLQGAPQRVQGAVQSQPGGPASPPISAELRGKLKQ